MEPWYRCVTPRTELREGRSLDPSEFAVHLEQVAAGTAPADYVEPDKFFARNFFSKALVDHCGVVLRRLNGEQAGTAPVLSLITQFGGGKTHTLTALYHLCTAGEAAKEFAGVAEMMKATGLKRVPKAKVAYFVGNAWDPQPGRETPWLDIADQLAGDQGRALFGTKAPGTKAIGELLHLVNEPVLILFDETLNYLGRHEEQANAFHSFMQNITSALTGAERAVGLFSLPASPTEMTDSLREWQDRLTKVVGRVGKDLVANDSAEVSEIVRRRLFQDAGRDSMRRAVARQFAGWVNERRDRLPPEWGQLSEDEVRAKFESCYPFHPATLTVFQRKWQSLAQFQQTRTTLAMLGLWISCAYRDGYAKARREPLLTLGSAPLSDRDFLSAVMRQMGETRLQAAILADVSAPQGEPRSHAETLDAEDESEAGRASIHQRVAKTLFFESCGGQTDKAAHLPELYFAVGDPDTETGLVHAAVQDLERRCYFLRAVGADGWRFGHVPTLKKVHADRKQALDGDDVRRTTVELTREVFKRAAEIHLTFFPRDSSEVSDQAMLTMVVLRPDESLEPGEESELRQRLNEWTRRRGQQNRENPGSILWVAPDSTAGLRGAVEDLMAWQIVSDEANAGRMGDLDPDDIRRIQRELSQAKSQIEERIWGSYGHLLLWDGQAQRLKEVPLGQLHPSEAKSISAAILARMRHDTLLSREIGASYIERNWPPALKDSGIWPLQGLKQAFFQGVFTRLEKADDALRATIGRAVSQGTLGLGSGKKPESFDRVWFKEPVDAADITFDADTYLLTAQRAKAIKDGGPSPVRQPPSHSGPSPVGVPTGPGPSPSPPQPTSHAVTIEWSGEVKREQWNLFSLKVLSKLASAKSLRIDVSFHAEVDRTGMQDDINDGLRDLGMDSSATSHE